MWCIEGRQGTEPLWRWVHDWVAGVHVGKRAGYGVKIRISCGQLLRNAGVAFLGHPDAAIAPNSGARGASGSLRLFLTWPDRV